jgi:hypothetical protein
MTTGKDIATSSNVAKTMTALANLPKALEAATFLNKLGLITEPPNEVVKRYVEANPCINATLARLK